MLSSLPLLMRVLPDAGGATRLCALYYTGTPRRTKSATQTNWHEILRGTISSPQT